MQPAGFLLGRVGGVVGGDAVDGAVQESLQQCLPVGGGADGDHLVLRVEGQGDQLPGGALQAQQLSRRLAQILGADGAVRPPPPDQQPAAVGVMGQQIRVAVPVQIQVVHQAGGVRQGERSPVGQTDLVFVPV